MTNPWHSLARLSAKLEKRAGRLAAWHGFTPGRNAKRVRAWRGSLSGCRAVIVGNGPSLRIEDLERARDQVCLASNKIHLVFPHTQWRPRCVFIEDPQVLLHMRHEWDRLRGVQVLLPHTASGGPSDALRYRYCWRRIPPPLRPEFGLDPLVAFHWGFTVTFTALQWAFYCGVREVCLIGVDFRYEIRGPATQAGPGGARFERSSGRSNHFSPDYYPEGVSWLVPDLEYQRMAFESARAFYSDHGGEIVNGTRGGDLEVFRRVDFDVWAAERRGGARE
ncbi:hypothetical protein ASA1KI_09380 [Opitutales bacterium ASA1]|nr:hypothetical protein ASA1KI_09380 [Opitutales bacterium ASA1]